MVLSKNNIRGKGGNTLSFPLSFFFFVFHIQNDSWDFLVSIKPHVAYNIWQYIFLTMNNMTTNWQTCYKDSVSLLLKTSLPVLEIIIMLLSLIFLSIFLSPDSYIMNEEFSLDIQHALTLQSPNPEWYKM